MPNPKKKTAQRGLVAAAATALVVGSSFMPAAAAPEVNAADSQASNSSASDSAVDTTGLANAIEEDLGKSVDEYLEDSKLNDKASALKKALKEAGIDSNVSIKNDKISVQVANANLDKANELIAGLAADAKDNSVVAKASDKPAEADAQQDKKAIAEDAKSESVKPVAAKTEAAKKSVNAAKVVDSGVLVTGIEKMTTIDGVLKQLQANLAPSEISRLTSVTVDARGQVKVTAGKSATTKSSKASLRAASPSASKNLTLEQFKAQAKAQGAADNVVFEYNEHDGQAKPAAETDIYDGMGYALSPDGNFAGQIGICSIGFNAWDKAGNDAIITAGHCTNDGRQKVAAVLEHSAVNEPSSISNLLGKVGFNQFGMAGNKGVSPDDPNWADKPTGTDIAIIDEINPALNLHPEVSQWPSGQDERDKTIKVRSVGEAALGAEACNSGRTTGWQCSTITEEGIFFVRGYDDNGNETSQDIRTVWGYTSDNPGDSVLDHGDSGGAVLVGSRAVGVNSALGGGLAMYTSLTDAMDKTVVKDYSVKLFISTPKANTANGTEVESEASLKGSVADAPKGTKVQVIVDGKVVQTVDVDSKGNFSFNAPKAEGQFNFTLKAVNGYNVSDTTEGNVVVQAPAPTEEPTETPTDEPTEQPTEEPTETPTDKPTEEPTEQPTKSESEQPTEEPTKSESEKPTASADDDQPTKSSEAKAPQKEEPKQNPKKDDQLADTGANSLPLFAAGGALALTGAAFLLFRRSARRHG